MTGVDLGTVLGNIGEAMEDAQDGRNKLEQVIFHCARAQTIALVAMIEELQAIRMELEQRA